MNDNLIVLGGGESGVGAAYLASQNGISVFLSDKNLIELKYKEILIDNGIEFEEGSHSIDKVLKASEIVKSPGIPNDSVLINDIINCLLYTSPSPRDRQKSRMPSSA